MGDVSVELVQESVTVNINGARGPAGPSIAHLHSQDSPATEWIVNHNLGFKPSVTLTTVGGVEMEANIVHISDNQVRVYFEQATDGYARLI